MSAAVSKDIKEMVCIAKVYLKKGFCRSERIVFQCLKTKAS